MFGCLTSLLGKVVSLVLLLLVAYAGFRWGPAFFPTLERWFGVESAAVIAESVPSEEIARSAWARIDEFRGSEGEEILALSGTEVTSVLRFELEELLPDGVLWPEIELSEGGLRARFRVATEEVPDIPGLGLALGILPDTITVEMLGSLVPFAGGGSALVVRRVEAAGVPLPGRLIPEILTALGRTDEAGLPPEAVLVPLPGDLESLFIKGDSLILVANR